MTDKYKELANRVVALGVGGDTDNRTGDGQDYYEMRKFERGVWTFDYMLEASKFVCDWRVAGALMEKFNFGHLSEIIGGAEFWTTEANPRTIIEACVEALEA